MEYPLNRKHIKPIYILFHTSSIAPFLWVSLQSYKTQAGDIAVLLIVQSIYAKNGLT